ncbi:MAG: glutamate racemase [Treponema sp.]|jgi:glutamate racemase|nr:glutamate racemase [Treponema sp.]
MDKRPVLFLDSGIGGLPYCQLFMGRNPGEQVIYVADRANFPYGSKDRAVLAEILSALIRTLDGLFRPKLGVLACNTASVSALSVLRERFPAILWVGTVPAVKPAIASSRKRSIGVLGTARTIDDPCIAELAGRYGPDCKVTGIAAPDLVSFVEHGGDSIGVEDQRWCVEPYVAEFRKAGVDAVVLGCTHFILLKAAFASLSQTEDAAGAISFFDSVDGVVNRAESLLEEKDLWAIPPWAVPPLAVPPLAVPENLLILTGDALPEEKWRQRAARAGLPLRLLKDHRTSGSRFPS